MFKLLKFKSWSLIGIWILVFGAFILLPQVAEAGLILNNPVYIGLNSGLVGYWSFDGPENFSTAPLDILLVIAIMALLTTPVQGFAFGGVFS